MQKYMKQVIVAAGLLAFATQDASAQANSGSWQGWLGCWRAAPWQDAQGPSANLPLVCITPTSNSDVVQVATITEGKVVSTQRIDASGREQAIDVKGCTGAQRGEWSADRRRVFLTADATCDGVQRSTSGILAITPTGEWLDVQGVTTGGDENVRVARYYQVDVSSAVPAEIAAALSERRGSENARIAAGAVVGTQAVVEASRAASPAVVEAWLLERGQKFALPVSELVALADAGVPGRVTDALVAVSNPQAFAIARPDTRRARADDEIVGRRIPVYMDPSPWGWGYDRYGRYGYGNGYGNGYYNGYGYGYGAPVIVVNPRTDKPSGRLVKGRGHTQDRQTGTTPSTSTSSSSGSSPSAGSSTSRPSEPAPSSTRTAKPRP